jgi:hypothetical protein
MGDHRLFADFSMEELEAEIKRRKEEFKRPEPLDLKEIKWGVIIDELEEVMNSLERGHRYPDDFESFLYEKVMEIVYGPDIWKWVKAKLDGE